MTALETDLQILEQAMRTFFQTMKRPAAWQKVTALAGISVDRPGAVILHYLATHPSTSCRLHELAIQLGIEAPSVTRKTQELEVAGYVSRLPDPQDRRAVSLKLTQTGEEVNAKLLQAQHSIISQALQVWPPEQRHQFVTLFERFSNDLAALHQTLQSK